MKPRAIRFSPDPSDHAILSFGNGEFQADWQALITDEAPKAGCCLVFYAHPQVVVGVQLRVQLGRKTPVLAQVVWIKEVPPGLVQVGMKYLE
jgi:hypothetical protein